MNVYKTKCCGVRDIHEIEGVEHVTIMQRIFDGLVTGLNGRFRGAHYLFTQAQEDGDEDYGDSLALFIRNNNLGTVVATEEATNPQSEHPLIAYLFTPDMDAIGDFLTPEVPALLPVSNDVSSRATDILATIEKKVGDYVKLTPRGRTLAVGTGFVGSRRILGAEQGTIHLCLVLEDAENQGGRAWENNYRLPVKYVQYLREGEEFASKYEI